MALRMAKLERDPRTGNWRARKVIPAECRRIIGKREDKPIWPGRLSETEARERFGLWLTDIEGRIADARAKINQIPRSTLDESEIDRLARLWKSHIVGEDEELRLDGLSPRAFDKLGEALDLVDSGLRYDFARGDTTDWDWEIEDFLASHGAKLKPGTGEFRRVAIRFMREWRSALDIMKARQEGDVVETPAVPDGPARVTVLELFDKFETAKRGRLADITLRGYRRKLSAFAAFVGEKDIRSLTDDDVYGWARHREEVDRIKPHIIQKNDVAAVSSVFSWAASKLGGQLVPANIAADVDLQAPPPVIDREPAFDHSEVRRILAAARRAAADDETHETRRNARRWVPWLCAYSGARVTEITQLRREDFSEEDGTWFFRIRPSAGSVKNRQGRRVPLHEHLVAEGFLGFLETISDGPLFYNPQRREKAEAVTSQAEIESQKLATWLAKAASLADGGVRINHGWRHTWKTEALGAGIEERIRDAIVGHSVAKQGRKYEHPHRHLAAAMARFPRYSLEEKSLTARDEEQRSFEQTSRTEER